MACGPGLITTVIKWCDHISGQLASLAQHRLNKVNADVIMASVCHQLIKAYHMINNKFIIVNWGFIHNWRLYDMMNKKSVY